MFKTIFVKQIFDAQEARTDARFAVFQREEQLPFSPCPGHEFFWGMERAQKVLAVTWNFEKSYFSCKVENEFPDNFSIDGFDFDELVEEAQVSGWELIKVYEAK